jgi:RHS repeat-associated protein
MELKTTTGAPDKASVVNPVTKDLFVIHIIAGTYRDSTQLIYLRARWYNPADGRFQSRDTWTGNNNRPLSFNRWNYVESNPINNSDPSGLEPSRSGYMEGMSFAAGLGQGSITGTEIVYDYATMTRAIFSYTGDVGGLFASIGVSAYAGAIAGFRYVPKQDVANNELFHSQLSELIIGDYSKDFDGFYAGASVSGLIGVGVGSFHSPDGNIKGSFSYIGLGKGFTPLGIEVVGFHTFYTVDPKKIDYYYDTKTHLVNKGKLISDILNGSYSPIPLGSAANSSGPIALARITQISIALTAANNFEKYYQPVYGPFLFCPPKQPGPSDPPQPLPFPPFRLP